MFGSLLVRTENFSSSVIYLCFVYFPIAVASRIVFFFCNLLLQSTSVYHFASREPFEQFAKNRSWEEDSKLWKAKSTYFDSFTRIEPRCEQIKTDVDVWGDLMGSAKAGTTINSPIQTQGGNHVTMISLL